MTQHTPEVAARFRDLVQKMIDADGRHGKVQRVAHRLGLHPTEVPNILSGKRTVGVDVARRAADELGIPFDYFEGKLTLDEAVSAPADFELGPTRQENLPLPALALRAVTVTRIFIEQRSPQQVRRLIEKGRVLAEELLASREVKKAKEIVGGRRKMSDHELAGSVGELAMMLSLNVRTRRPANVRVAARRAWELLMKKEHSEADINEIKALAEVLADDVISNE